MSNDKENGKRKLPPLRAGGNVQPEPATSQGRAELSPEEKSAITSYQIELAEFDFDNEIDEGMTTAQMEAFASGLVKELPAKGTHSPKALQLVAQNRLARRREAEQDKKWWMRLLANTATGAIGGGTVLLLQNVMEAWF